MEDPRRSGGGHNLLDTHEALTFKMRTKHGSGLKEQYSLVHVTDLRLDPLTRAKRSPDYMKVRALTLRDSSEARNAVSPSVCVMARCT